jgi:hypothetical protein
LGTFASDLRGIARVCNLADPVAGVAGHLRDGLKPAGELVNLELLNKGSRLGSAPAGWVRPKARVALNVLDRRNVPDARLVVKELQQEVARLEAEERGRTDCLVFALRKVDDVSNASFSCLVLRVPWLPTG